MSRTTRSFPTWHNYSNDFADRLRRGTVKTDLSVKGRKGLLEHPFEFESLNGMLGKRFVKKIFSSRRRRLDQFHITLGMEDYNAD